MQGMEEQSRNEEGAVDRQLTLLLVASGTFSLVIAFCLFSAPFSFPLLVIAVVLGALAVASVFMLHQLFQYLDHRAVETPSEEGQAEEAAPVASPIVLPRINIDSHDSLRERIARLSTLCNKSAVRLKRYEDIALRMFNTQSPEQMRDHVKARRILGALEERIKLTRQALAADTAEGTAKAVKLLNEPLALEQDRVHSLITSERLPEIPAKDWESHLEALLTDLEQEQDLLRSSH